MRGMARGTGPGDAEKRAERELEAQLRAINDQTPAHVLAELDAKLTAARAALVAEFEAELRAAHADAIATGEKAAELGKRLAFREALYESNMRYIALEEEDVEQEYLRAGKLHLYDPDKEWQKRYARVAKLHLSPEKIAADDRISEYIKYLEEEEDESPMVPSWLIGECN